MKKYSLPAPLRIAQNSKQAVRLFLRQAQDLTTAAAQHYEDEACQASQQRVGGGFGDGDGEHEIKVVRSVI